MEKLTANEKQSLINSIIYEERRNAKRINPYSHVTMAQEIAKEIIRFTKSKSQ